MIRESRFLTHLKGLICHSCEEEVEGALLEKKGILSASVSYIKATATISYDPDVISEDEIKAILTDAGYPPCEKARSGIVYDILTLLASAFIILLLKVITLPSIPSVGSTEGIMFYLNVFLIGLVTGTHCIVMCGGIMLSSAGGEEKKRGRWVNITLYNLSRVIFSALLGFIFASFGSVLSFSEKMKSMIYVFVGLYVIFKALAMWGLPIIREIEALFPALCPFARITINASPLVLGAVTAVMPCSASSAMWMTAVTLSSGVKGALMMALWALGTVPMMMLFGLISKREKGRYYGVGIRINIVLLLSLGLRLLLMGI